ncbi:hypothetical protein X949_5154 [Burkholderia pseudomallei MSHR5609]|nr:hypothetical protein X949_5154 [Burkholderia pseudomallei MSHR5609]
MRGSEFRVIDLNLSHGEALMRIDDQCCIDNGDVCCLFPSIQNIIK